MNQINENKISFIYLFRNINFTKHSISIERRPHYCSNANEDIITKKNEEVIGNNIDINKELETNVILNNNNVNNDKN